MQSDDEDHDDIDVDHDDVEHDDDGNEAGDAMFKCGLCDYASKWKSNLKIHVNGVHKRQKKFQCPQCPYRANQKVR